MFYGVFMKGDEKINHVSKKKKIQNKKSISINSKRID